MLIVRSVYVVFHGLVVEQTILKRDCRPDRNCKKLNQDKNWDENGNKDNFWSGVFSTFSL